MPIGHERKLFNSFRATWNPSTENNAAREVLTGASSQKSKGAVHLMQKVQLKALALESAECPPIWPGLAMNVLHIIKIEGLG